MPPRANRKICAILISALLATSLVVFSTRVEQHHDHGRLDASDTLSGPFKALFSFRAPSAFFTPTATISLTDDNSTYFAARPAAFGPILPTKGLSGQLWIGNGFANGMIGNNLDASTEGELGCEDAPGWIHREWHKPLASLPSGGPSAIDDGGISGKVALLSRGGCSFSEKVKWAQTRGAAAVIVGDNIVGGPLVRMYSKGDASNISIPSLFTSHTTAHLLSSLVPIDTHHGQRTHASTDKSYEVSRIHSSPIASLNAKNYNQAAEEKMNSAREHKPVAMWSRELARRLGSLRSARTYAHVPARPRSAHLGRKSIRAPVSQHVQGSSSLEHQGLWVTLTPTNMSTSPFLNTLFVLVVSPLITLAIVYTMLLLRSRIRRRRWRAPKSIVERLPVRVYHTLSTSNSNSSSSSTVVPLNSTSTNTTSTNTIPTSTNPTNTATSIQTQVTPLLAEAEPSGSSTSGSHYGSCEAGPHDTEKPDTGLAAWRKKYGGRQVECVVCLEEYEDGVSKVMSLPCGHEFHVDCITPWLTTRRRTCPICKGDVVRSLIHDDAAAMATSTEGLSYEDVQTQAAETVNNSPSAAMPVPDMPAALDSITHDLEQGAHGQVAGSSGSSWYSGIQRRIDSYFSPPQPQRPATSRTSSPPDDNA